MYLSTGAVTAIPRVSVTTVASRVTTLGADPVASSGVVSVLRMVVVLALTYTQICLSTLLRSKAPKAAAWLSMTVTVAGLSISAITCLLTVLGYAL